MKTKNVLRPALFGLFLFLLSIQSATAGQKHPLEGNFFPDLALEPASTQEKKYFRLTDLPWETLVVQIFSMYCPHCQREAPKVNELYELLDQGAADAQMGIVGIGAGNSAYEVKIFREKFSIEFPLFADQDYLWHKALQEPGTPFFFVLRRKDGGLLTVHAHSGPFKTPESFLKTIKIKVAGTNEESGNE